MQLCITQTKQRRTFEFLFFFLSMLTDFIAFTCWVDCHGIGYILCAQSSIYHSIHSDWRDWPLSRPYQISKSFHSFKIRVCLSNKLMISSYFKQCAWPLYAVGSFNPFHILISNWNKIRAKWWNEWTKMKENTVHKLYYEGTWLDLIEVPCTVNSHRNHDVIRDSKSNTASCREYKPW